MSEQAPNQTHEPDIESLQESAMTEASDSSIHKPLPSVTGEDVEDIELRAIWEAADEQRAAYAAWLERRGMLEDTPRLTMTGREFELLRERS